MAGLLCQHEQDFEGLSAQQGLFAGWRAQLTAFEVELEAADPQTGPIRGGRRW
ncbi:MAG TPA: hypothetical protein PLX45_00360 [Piscinibacter sp.]|uniref:hypothetical protein n=1 Tax=Piscinibacter sp. TaxID=1903157 RepID=UPI0025DCFA07|nr:hypothetical protein [Piscinibacter sp.]HOY33748.1 hypothetical protein [Piscinibacter sp.]HPM64673.1 hypothetical protein [Piscinibacter sp.]